MIVDQLPPQHQTFPGVRLDLTVAGLLFMTNTSSPFLSREIPPIPGQYLLIMPGPGVTTLSRSYFSREVNSLSAMAFSQASPAVPMDSITFIS